MTLREFTRDNGLILAMFGIFFVTIVGMSFAGWMSNNETLDDHSRPAQSYGSYLVSGDFIEGVFENWESEFLQMWALVILTIFLYQKGSSDSKPLRGKAPQDTRPARRLANASSWRELRMAGGSFIYSHSLGIVLFMLFLLSFTLHASGGVAAYNEEAMHHGSETISMTKFVTTSDFWYQSLQNWQSEFLAVGTLMILTVKLRERGSPQSKPVGTKYDQKTGS